MRAKRGLGRWFLALTVGVASGMASIAAAADGSIGLLGQGAAGAPTRLVELTSVVPGLVLDVRYATANNFTKKVVYPSARVFLAEPAALALRAAQADLGRLGYGLKVFDGYRPLSVQRKFWAILPDPRYVADPRKGSRHNRGYAVDASLVDRDRRAVPMPTEYDDFSERAAIDNLDVPEPVIRNRELLASVMVRHGFLRCPTEWWHFDFHGYEGKPLLDVSLTDLCAWRDGAAGAR